MRFASANLVGCRVTIGRERPPATDRFHSVPMTRPILTYGQGPRRRREAGPPAGGPDGGGYPGRGGRAAGGAGRQVQLRRRGGGRDRRRAEPDRPRARPEGRLPPVP